VMTAVVLSQPYLLEDNFNNQLRLMQQVSHLAIDTEGTLNHPFATTWGLSSSAFGSAQYFPFNHRFGVNMPKEWLPRLKEVVYNHPCLVMHNAKHDLRALRALFGEEYLGNFYCTMMMGHWVNENRFNQGLDSLSKAYGGHPKEMPDAAKSIIKAMELMGKNGWEYIPADLMYSYAAHDAFITEELFPKVKFEFDEQEFDGNLWNVEQDFIRLMAKVEDNGVLIDQSLSERELERGLGIMADLQKELGFNPGSSKELGNFLINELGLPVILRSKKTNKPSFNKAVMEVYDELLSQRDDNRAKMILTYRGWAKTTSSNYKPYLELLGPDGRLHANFKLHGTKTGRMSCEHPNLQQIPKSGSKDWNGRLKQAFIVENGRTAWTFDFSQLEFRLGAAYGRQKRLIEIFNDDSRDVFTEMAKDLGLNRDRTKTLVYTTQFGGGVDRLMTVFGMSRLAAKAILDNFWTVNNGIAAAKNLAARRCLENGYVRYWTGRRRHFMYPRDEAHKAFNAVCQGGAFEIVKRRMVAIDKAGLNNDECRMDLQVHDELRFDIENGKEDIYIPEIKRIMEDVRGFGVKFKVGADKWGAK